MRVGDSDELFLIVVVVTQLYIFVKIQTCILKGVNLSIFKLHLNKPDFKNKKRYGQIHIATGMTFV